MSGGKCAPVREQLPQRVQRLPGAALAPGGAGGVEELEERVEGAEVAEDVALHLHDGGGDAVLRRAGAADELEPGGVAAGGALGGLRDGEPEGGRGVRGEASAGGEERRRRLVRVVGKRGGRESVASSGGGGRWARRVDGRTASARATMSFASLSRAASSGAAADTP